MSTDTTAAGIAAGIIATSRNAGNAVRLALLRLPDATIDIREKVIRGAARTQLTVTARANGDSSLAHAKLGDLLFELCQEPYSLHGERDGELRIRVRL